VSRMHYTTHSRDYITARFCSRVGVCGSWVVDWCSMSLVSVWDFLLMSLLWGRLASSRLMHCMHIYSDLWLWPKQTSGNGCREGTQSVLKVNLSTIIWWRGIPWKLYFQLSICSKKAVFSQRAECFLLSTYVL